MKKAQKVAKIQQAHEESTQLEMPTLTMNLPIIPVTVPRRPVNVPRVTIVAMIGKFMVKVGISN